MGLALFAVKICSTLTTVLPLVFIQVQEDAVSDTVGCKPKNI